MAVPFLNFFQKPANELEKGGRPAPVNQDENEPSQTCPNCHRAIPLSQFTATGVFDSLVKMKYEIPNDDLSGFARYEQEIDAALAKVNAANS